MENLHVGEKDDVRVYYASGAELERLDLPLGVIEFTRTKEIVERHLPPPPARVIDVGGGPGRYAIWLAERGHQVIHRDLVQLHVDRTLADARAAGVAVDSGIADARSLDVADDVADVVLLLGPLYHLTERGDRMLALAEARRVGRSGGWVFVAAISRWAPRLHGILVDRIYEGSPDAMALVETVERTGVLPPLFDGSFSGFCHRPDELRDEAASAGLDIVDLVGVEGLAFALADLRGRVAADRERDIVLDAARAVERVPELMGLGPHLILTARIP
jgi:SAM-dependent methyltransferase